MMTPAHDLALKIVAKAEDAILNAQYDLKGGFY
jgi:hypothetical protein